MSKEETPALKIRHFKNDEHVKDLASKGTLKNNRFTIPKKAVDEFLANEGATTEMRQKVADANAKLFEAGSRLSIELLDQVMRTGKEAGQDKDVLEKTQVTVSLADPNYKLEIRNTAREETMNPADRDNKIVNFGKIAIKSKVKTHLDKKIYEESANAVKSIMESLGD